MRELGYPEKSHTADEHLCRITEISDHKLNNFEGIRKARSYVAKRARLCPDNAEDNSEQQLA
jgi:hypothetical protein